MKQVLILSLLVVSSFANAQMSSGNSFLDALINDLESTQKEAPVDSNRQDFIKSGTVKIFQNDKDSLYIGSGFFLEEDFPLLHTALHVMKSLKKDRPVFIQLPDRTTFEIKAKQWGANTSYSNYDHAVLDLTSHARKIQNKVATFRRAQNRPRFLEQLYASGFPASAAAKWGNEDVVRSFMKEIPIKISIVKAQLCYSPDVLARMIDRLPDGAFYTDMRPPLSVYLRRGLEENLDPLVNDPEAPLPPLESYLAPANNYRFYNVDFAIKEAQREEFIMKDNYCGHGLVLPGMSGGPIVNSNNEVIGVNSKGGNLVLLYPDLTDDKVFLDRR